MNFEKNFPDWKVKRDSIIKELQNCKTIEEFTAWAVYNTASFLPTLSSLANKNDKFKKEIERIVRQFSKISK